MVETLVLAVNPEDPEPEAISAAAAAIAAGKLVAFPTETVYGLGANATDPGAVARIFAAKERPFTDPLIVHVPSIDAMRQVVAATPAAALRAAEAFWPGPLTLVLERSESVAPNVAGGRNTVAVRIPAHVVALALLRAAGLPIAAPSANLFSRPSPTTAQHVLTDLGGRVDMILDGGSTTIGLESTVVDLTADPPVLLRPGGVPAEVLVAVLPNLWIPAAPAITRGEAGSVSPGTLLKHYSPQARVVLLGGQPDAALMLAQQLIARLQPRGVKVAVIVADEERPAFAVLPAEIVALGPAGDMDAMGRALFARLRELDMRGIDLILARDVPQEGLGRAIHDRLFRAAEGRVLGPETDMDSILNPQA